MTTNRLLYTTALALATTMTLGATPALAGQGTLSVEKKGMIPTWVWVDGVAKGKLKGKSPLVMTLPEGWHEVWYAAEDTGTVTLCHGLVNVPNGGSVSTLSRMMGCDGLMEGFPHGPSAFKGADVVFQVDSALDAWVKIDGGQVFAFPDMPFVLNLAPGQHTFVIYNDVMQETVFDQGTVTLGPGERLNVTCTTAGCIGFDQPPFVIVELVEAAQDIRIATPGVSFNFNMNVQGGGAGAAVGVSASDGTGGGVQMGMQVDDGTGGGSMRMDVQVDEESGGGSISIDVDIEE